jgi:hypothetical protein
VQHAHFAAKVVEFSVEVIDFGVEVIDFGVEGIDFDLERVDLDLQPVDFDLQPVDFDLEPVDFDLERIESAFNCDETFVRHVHPRRGRRRYIVRSPSEIAKRVPNGIRREIVRRRASVAETAIIALGELKILLCYRAGSNSRLRPPNDDDRQVLEALPP